MLMQKNHMEEEVHPINLSVIRLTSVSCYSCASDKQDNKGVLPSNPGHTTPLVHLFHTA